MRKQTIAQVLVIAIFAQSCVAYQKTSTSMSNAIDQGKVKLVTKEGYKHKLKTITEIDGKYYGKVNFESGMIPIDSSSVKEIYLHDKGKSAEQTAALVVGITLGVGILFSVALVKALKEMSLDLDLDASSIDWGF